VPTPPVPVNEGAMMTWDKERREREEKEEKKKKLNYTSFVHYQHTHSIHHFKTTFMYPRSIAGVPSGRALPG